MNINKLIEENKKLKKEVELLKAITREYNSYKCKSNSDTSIIIADLEYFNKGYFKSNFVSKEDIKYCLTKLNGAVDHFEKRKDNNVIIRVKKILEDLIKED